MFYRQHSTVKKSSTRLSRFFNKFKKINIYSNQFKLRRLHFAGRGGKGHFVSTATHNWNRKGRW